MTVDAGIQREDAARAALVEAIKARGFDASDWHSGGGIMVVTFADAKFEVMAGLADYPRWGFDLYNHEGDLVEGSVATLGCTIDTPADEVASELLMAAFGTDRRSHEDDVNDLLDALHAVRRVAFAYAGREVSPLETKELEAIRLLGEAEAKIRELTDLYGGA